MDKLRVGFIGAGRIADLHALAYQDNPEAEIYAVCDSEEEVASRRAQEWGAQRWLSDYRELLRDDAVDAVEILTPHHLHAEMTIAALEAGKHVSLQKPMSVNLSEADAMIAAAQRSGKLFRVCENFRYYPPFVKAKELLDEGAIG
jgi:predicted dehydrogenase